MKDKALVLGGGGVGGIAWMTGLLFGLSEHNVDLRTADLTIGTSAGATLAAQLGSEASIEDLFQRMVSASGTREMAPSPSLLEAFQKARSTFATIENRTDRIRQIGKWALETPTVAESDRRAAVAERLPSHSWPEAELQDRGRRCPFQRDDRVRSKFAGPPRRRRDRQLRCPWNMASSNHPWQTLHRRRRALSRERRSGQRLCANFDFLPHGYHSSAHRRKPSERTDRNPSQLGRKNMPGVPGREFQKSHRPQSVFGRDAPPRSRCRTRARPADHAGHRKLLAEGYAIECRIS